MLTSPAVTVGMSERQLRATIHGIPLSKKWLRIGSISRNNCQQLELEGITHSSYNYNRAKTPRALCEQSTESGINRC